MVTGLPEIRVPKDMCRNCLVGKQSRKSFVDHIAMRAKEKLDVVTLMCVVLLTMSH
jgi:hypothetical protein